MENTVIVDEAKENEVRSGQNVVENKEQELPSDPAILTELYKQEKAKAARILSEKRAKMSEAEQLQARLVELEKAEKERKLASMTEAEKYKTLLEEKEAELASWRTQVEEKEKDLQSFQRKTKLSEYTKDVQFLPSIDPEIREFAIERAFGSIDLNDVNAINEAKKALIEKNKALIVASAARGAGTETKTKKNSVEGMARLTKEAYLAMSKADRLKVSSDERARLAMEE